MSSYLPSLYQEQIHIRHYARWNEEAQRRETWEETVDRYIQQAIRQAERKADGLTLVERAELRDAILNLRVMPSMRALMTAGKALERDNVAGYNCAYVAVDDPRVFDETLFVLCCGTGVGFSVENKHIAKLPQIATDFKHVGQIVVEDSKEGWADAFRQLIEALYRGEIPEIDASKVRPAGQRLKTFGGRSSGPEPLLSLFEYVIAVFQKAAGRQLTNLECHGIMCKIGDIVVVGGVRRSALISLYDPEDEVMANAKSGEWYEDPERKHFRLANNSAVWSGTPDYDTFLDQQWKPLRDSMSGEPGIVNREALQRKAAENGRRDPNYEFGVNPCGEIILRPNQFCNLTEIVARPDDEFEDLIEKARLASILGTIQASFTDFRYIRDIWRENCEEERLLGVSITGAMDNPILNGSRGRAELRGTLHALKHVVIDTNREWAARFNMNPTAAGTCNKPSGTVSKLVLSGSGMNEWHSKHFVQTNRGHKSDPASQFLYVQGVPCEDDVMDPDNTFVFSYPIKAPEGALTRKDMSALRKLQMWLDYAEMWCEHNPSTTINLKDHEWDEAGKFVHANFDKIAGVAFFPYDDHTYAQAPYQEITEEKYHELVAEMPKNVDWTILADLEHTDNTSGSQELACVGNQCEIVA